MEGPERVKAIRIVQLVVVVLLGIYLWVFHTMNQDYVQLPLLPSMRPALVVLLAVIVAWGAAWLPAQARIWRLKRRLQAVADERDAFAAELGHVDHGIASPVIPDRTEPIDPYATGSDVRRRGEDPTDYL